MPMLLKPITRMNAAELASIPNAWEDGPGRDAPYMFRCPVCGGELRGYDDLYKSGNLLVGCERCITRTSPREEYE